jgi:cytochrome P450
VEPHVLFFPSLAPYFITPYERKVKANATAIRRVVMDIVQKRRNTPKEELGSDLLSIMLCNEIFAEDDESIVDELLTVFFAGS